MRFIFVIVMLLGLSSCYTVNPDGTINIPQRTINDIHGRWVGFNDNLLVGFRLDVNMNGKGKAITQLFDETGEEFDVDVKIESNVVTATPTSGEMKEPLKFYLEPTLMTMASNQEVGQLVFKVVLVKEEHLKQKIEQLTK